MDADVRVARIGRRQRGLVTHRQCERSGLDDHAIAVRLAAWGWTRERHGVYALPGAPPTWERALLGVTLRFDDCWISHGSAAALWELKHAPTIDAIEVLRPYGKSRRLDGVRLHRSRLIAAEDVSRHRGIAVTTVARTILECSGRLTPTQVGEMLDDAIRRRLTTLERVRACFARLASGGRRRLRAIKVALAIRIPGYDPGESDLEITTLRALLAAGLPVPTQQHRVTLNGKRRRIDLAYVREKVAIELQGWTWHGGRAAFDADKARSGELIADGWVVVEITSQHDPADYTRWVAGALDHRRAA